MILRLKFGGNDKLFHMKRAPIIPSVNFHLWEPCNMRCTFCFATFQDVKKQILPKGHLPKEEAIRIVRQLADFGFEKITFAGGEPTLCPWLNELILAAKSCGMTTMIVTNGTVLKPDYLEQMQSSLDWIALSMDSINPEVNILSGRAVAGKKPLDVSAYLEIVNSIKTFGFGLKINTVVHQLNYTEDLNDFISEANPSRWKVLQTLLVEGQNNLKVAPFLINDFQFQDFLNRHGKQKSLVPESNEVLKGSYVMVDPAGRFFTNTSESHTYSQPILEAGIESAYYEMHYSNDRFKKRGGFYDWGIVDNGAKG